MIICKRTSITIAVVQILLWSVVENAPIVPILTALATSAVGIFQVQVDTLHIAKYLREAADVKRNRAAFVRDLLYTAFYKSGQGYNVIVFNLSEEHRQRLYGVLFYGSIQYSDGTRFGVWVFEHGVFENHGNRGWHNWGMIGSFKKSNNGETIYFQRRHLNKHNKPPVEPNDILRNFKTEVKEVKNEMPDKSKKEITVKVGGDLFDKKEKTDSNSDSTTDKEKNKKSTKRSSKPKS